MDSDEADLQDVLPLGDRRLVPKAASISCVYPHFTVSGFYICKILGRKNKEKPHSRYLECGFVVTPTDVKQLLFTITEEIKICLTSALNGFSF